MALPDSHKDEPAVQLDESLFTRWREAESNAARWKEIASKLREMLEEQMGEASAGKIGDDKVLTYRPTKKYAEARIVKDYPDLVVHFMRVEPREFFDFDSFKMRHPDIAEQYRVRSMRVVGE